MYNITYNLCHKALCSYIESDQFIIKEYGEKVAEDKSKGLMGSSTKVICKVEINDNINDITFFMKTLPLNIFHKSIAIETGAFLKETFFYKTISNNLKKYLNGNKIYPDCYYIDNEKIILEDLTINSYKTYNLNKEFDVEHCLHAIKCLAEFHAASFLYEHDLNITLDKLYPEIMFLAWYSDIETHPGHKHMITTFKAIKSILDIHFINQPLTVRDKFIEILNKLPKQFKSSSVHRNCLSHLDLWCNNIMFKYNNDNKVDNAVIIDYQLLAYSPPAVDLMMLIYLNTSDNIRKLYFNKFIKHYYNSFSNLIISNNKRPELFLTYNDLLTTISEYLEVALSITIGFKHFVLIPDHIILPIVNNDDLFKHFLFTDRNELVLNTINDNNDYKENIFIAINDLFHFINDFNCDGRKALQSLIHYDMESNKRI